MHMRRDSGSEVSQPTETGPKFSDKKIHALSDREECQEFQLLVVQLLQFPFVDEDEGDKSVSL